MPLDVSRIQALCFDVDGTLRDTDDQYVARIGRLFSPASKVFKRWDHQQTSRRIVMTFDTPINAIYTMLDWMRLDATMIGILDKLGGKNKTPSKISLPLVPGTRDGLESLRPHFPMTIVSARGELGTRAFLQFHKLEEMFLHVASGQTTPHTKPWPDPIFWCAEKLGIPPENCLMIGDTTVDIRAGRSAGAQTVGVLSGFGSRRELSRVGADEIIESVSALPDLLLNR